MDVEVVPERDESGGAGSPGRPLVVDMDGTLIRSDLLVESFFALLSTAPHRALLATVSLVRGRAAFKARVGKEVTLNLRHLPLSDAMVSLLRDEKAKGRRIYLASAGHGDYVRGLAEELGLFDGVFASDEQTNLRGATKAQVLSDAFGPGGFDYAGDSTADLAVWQAAHKVIVVNASPSLIRIAHRRFADVTVVEPRTKRAADYLRALRPHQWLKNLLLFVPALAAHQFNATTAVACLLAFASFSLCASSVYLLNDLLDLRHDRQHPTKHRRPLASGRVHLVHGAFLAPALLLAAAIAALALPVKFLLVLGIYYALTTAYSVYLKRQPVMDVLTLAGLYGIRVYAGAVAIAVVVSPWLLTFSMFLFLCLALVKRTAELIERFQSGGADPAGRGYRLTDVTLLQTMATSSGYVAVLVFGLYISSVAATSLYDAPERLWVVPGILLYWISRILILTHRGEMHDDPVLFAATDRTSLACGALSVLAVLASI